MCNRSHSRIFRAKAAQELQDPGGQRVGGVLVESVCPASNHKLQNLAGTLRDLAILGWVGIHSASLPNAQKK